jgi:hypothetical protein
MVVMEQLQVLIQAHVSGHRDQLQEDGLQAVDNQHLPERQMLQAELEEADGEDLHQDQVYQLLIEQD